MARIVVAASYAPSLVNFRGHLLRQMIGRGHSVAAVAPNASDSCRAWLDELGASYYDIGASRGGTNPAEDICYMFRLNRLFRHLRPDVVLSYTIKPNIYASIAARLAGVPRIFSLVTGLGFAFETESDGRSFTRKISRHLLRLAFTISDGVILQNHDDLADVTRLGVLTAPEKALVVNGSGIDLDEFESRPVPNGAPSFLLIARLLANKGIREYAEAARIVKESHPDARFHLIGWFDENPAGLTHAEVEAWQRQGVVEYHGSVDDVGPWLAGCHVYVLPSYREGTPRTVLEAMATGRPVITTDVPGCRQTVADGDNGYLVRARDPVALASAMKKFLGEPDSVAVMGARSRRLAEQKYDVRLVSKNMLQFMGLD